MSSGRLWDKGAEADASMLRFTARDDWQLDQRLLAFDLLATQAHVRGLERIGALSAAERDSLATALDQLEKERAAGEFLLTPEVEDGHTAIELALTARLGDLGKKVHLGRSRNDQVLVATRLYERAELRALAGACVELGKAFLAMASQHEKLLMPGYTHLQRAVPQTVGHWAGCYLEGFSESARALLLVIELTEGCPLGAAAGYGVNLPLDREGVARELGFAEIAENPLWSQTSRGMTEVMLLSAVWHAMAVARRLAWDVSLFCSAEFGFVSLPENLTTGSSIMPNKRNPDVVELLRASCSIVQGSMAELMSLASLPSGYHRDLQLTKGAMMRALNEARDALGAALSIAESIVFDAAKLAGAISTDMLATDRAVELARAGMPFREAYKQVAAELGEPGPASPEAAAKSVAARVSPGAPGALRLSALETKLKDLEKRLGTASAS